MLYQVFQPVPVLNSAQSFLQVVAVLLEGLAEGHLRVFCMVGKTVLTQSTLAGRAVQVSNLQIERFT